MKKILIIGASGQIGTDLTLKLNELFGTENVIVADIREPNREVVPDNIYEKLDVLDINMVKEIVTRYKITDIYHLAAMLSGKAELNPGFAWHLNMNGLFNVLNVAKDNNVSKVFWPSSIAAFGPNSKKQNTPQYDVMDPNTVYGISKVSGELWAQYYYEKYGLDVRSLRYPGLISYKTEAGGGTTDYAVEIFYEAIKKGSYTSFLDKGTTLPMMYMDDAIRATIELMEADKEKIKIRTSYNIAAISFAPEELAAEIKKHIPEFKITYEPDFRQKIAESWPQSIDDSRARTDWGWSHEYNLTKMTEVMLKEIEKKIKHKV
jgi:nucleoside-diphosphate-sugar epimerase